ncbi:type III-A CRISPR-associated protein Csm6 [Staphylococcus ursi]|uniref:type III-A CRISPR-associated CARF protein Csm6 n=1 Tax=Staphylococcus sp. MI 10-1553 TaxID=1912064 RepID=UPI001398AD2D|nr:type III-A CRISPR-associated CARF protein Csm6 [Staphylococcus sp. MI 10-1553]QHW35988.1 type III-A CRISPR-associated protein Csm6 [Staphylococcus sp. MI 10-1553]
MKILFSPIGNTDPWSNYRDGAMLHIVRQYRPDKIVLFFTESIWNGNENMPGRKEFNWNKIISSVSPDSKVEIKIDKVENEHDFDSYKELFHNYILEIMNEEPNAEVLLNVTSGTPQMESTLCLEYVTYPNHKECIQVATPEPEKNIKRIFANPNDQEEALQKVNENEMNSKIRSKSIDIISFREAMIRSQIIGLIYNYDYEAALTLISEQKSFRNAKNLRKKLLLMTTQVKTHEIFPEINASYNNKALKKVLFHYLILKMRYDRQDVAETLIRVKSIAEFIIRDYIEVHYPNIIIEENGKPYLNTNDNMPFLMKYQKRLKNEYKSYVPQRILSLPTFIDILKVLSPKSPLLKELLAINDVNGLRNSVAHHLDTLKLDRNKNHTKIRLSVESIKNMLNIAYPEIDEKDFNYFEEKNKELIGLL